MYHFLLKKSLTFKSLECTEGRMLDLCGKLSLETFKVTPHTQF